MNGNKRSVFIKAVVWVLVALMVAGVAGTAIFSVFGEYTQEDVNELKDRLDEISSRKDQIDEELAAIKDKESSQMERKTELESKLQDMSDTVNEAETLLADLDAALADKNAQIDEAQRRLDEQYETYKKRVRFTYEEGTVSYLAVVLDADSFSDMLIRFEYVSMMLQQDRDVIASVTELRGELEQARDEAEQAVALQQETRDKLEAQYEVLEQTFSETQNVLSDLESNKQNLSDEYARIDAEEEAIDAEIEEMLAEIAKQGAVYVGGTFLWPTPGYYYITSPYGYRVHPITGAWRLHAGTDIGASSGTPILAANSGTVLVSTYHWSYGNYVLIDHGGGYATLYAHMSTRACSEGDYVEQGETIGYVGSTGDSTGPHLHFEVRVNGSTVDPMSYFS